VEGNDPHAAKKKNRPGQRERNVGKNLGGKREEKKAKKTHYERGVFKVYKENGKSRERVRACLKITKKANKEGQTFLQRTAEEKKKTVTKLVGR